jgi:hypothetical protein
MKRWMFLLLLIPALCFAGPFSNYYRSMVTSAEETIMDSYSESNESVEYTLYSGGQIARGQTFTGNGDDVTKAVFNIRKNGSPTGSAYAKIWASTGTCGTNGTPTGSAVATSNALDVATLQTSRQLETLTFGTPYTTVNTTCYVITLTYNGGDVDNNVGMGHDNSSPSHDGNRVYSDDESSWTGQNTVDACFYVYGN